jgi:hypothetical protein
MKKIILFVVLAIVFASCKKSSSSSPVNTNTTYPINTITATINDTVYIFNQDILDSTVYNNGQTTLVFEATDLNLNTAVFEISTTHNIPLTPTTYGLFGDTTHLVIFGYALPSSIAYFTFTPAPTNGITVTVDSLTSTFIKGTFEGTIYLNADTSSANKKPVTNGTFSFTKPITTQ